MRRQKRTKQLSAAVAIYLSLNIQVQDEHGPDWMLAIPVLPLNFWLWWGWQFQTVVDRLATTIVNQVVSIGDRVQVALMVLSIGWKSSLYGLGVPI